MGAPCMQNEAEKNNITKSRKYENRKKDVNRVHSLGLRPSGFDPTSKGSGFKVQKLKDFDIAHIDALSL